jgi:hypothetical protein
MLFDLINPVIAVIHVRPQPDPPILRPNLGGEILGKPTKSHLLLHLPVTNLTPPLPPRHPLPRGRKEHRNLKRILPILNKKIT